MRDGAEAMSELVASSVPFVRFRVQRVLAQGDHASPEGRDRMLEQLRPVLGPLPAGAMRMELTRIVSERLSLPPSLVERALAEGGASSMVGGDGREAVGHTGMRGGGRTNGGAAGAGAAAGRAGAGESAAARERAGAGGRASAGGDAGASLSARGVSTERAFLALCIASPGAGEQALA